MPQTAKNNSETGKWGFEIWTRQGRWKGEKVCDFNNLFCVEFCSKRCFGDGSLILRLSFAYGSLLKYPVSDPKTTLVRGIKKASLTYIILTIVKKINNRFFEPFLEGWKDFFWTKSASVEYFLYICIFIDIWRRFLDDITQRFTAITKSMPSSTAWQLAVRNS